MFMNVAHAFPSVPFAQTRARSSVASVILGRSRRILRPASSERMRSRAARSAKKAVVSNATPFDTVKMLPDGGDAPELPEGVRDWKKTLGKLPRHGAIMHLFLAIDATDLDLSHIEDPAHLIIQDWGRSMQDSQNLCSFFIPSLLDPSVCPEGKHVIHVYSSGGAPYEEWENLTPDTPEYEAKKKERSEVLWRAVERCIPDVRERIELELVGSPLTHARFLRRHRGTYGPELPAGSQAFPGARTPVPGLYVCGDSTWPGIGVPAVAGSGIAAAHAIVGVGPHRELLQEMRERGALVPSPHATHRRSNGCARGCPQRCLSHCRLPCCRVSLPSCSESRAPAA